MTAKWQALLKRVPELPVGSCMFGPGKGSSTCLLPGQQLPASTSNSENADLCAPQSLQASSFAPYHSRVMPLRRRRAPVPCGRAVR